MELENQIGILKSTIDLYKKTNEQRKNQNFSADSTCSRDHTVSESCKVEPSCTHKCYSDLADKIQENRLRAIETQMMQNMYISKAMHINLATQIRNSYRYLLHMWNLHAIMDIVPFYHTTGRMQHTQT